MPATASLGTTLKKLRKDRGLTLSDVTSRSGIPRSTVSKIENDQTSPTFENLTRLSACFDVDIVELFSEVSNDQSPRRGGRLSLNRLGSGDVIRLNGQILHYLSTNLLDKKFTPIIAEIHARSLAEFGPMMFHTGDEFLFVLEGELEFHTDTYTPMILQAGESVYFDSSMGHAYVARGDKPCRTLSICTVSKDVASEQLSTSAEAPPMEPRRRSAATSQTTSRPRRATRPKAKVRS